ncbi:hypothetical protein E2C01_029605 [Portunus trituberculatus]|uniref:Uncharacterized protein n=1 Tax=Portunus trituberculatus TaxID=210409 RepID=A0A5B7ESD2_PORTR|nr:hypothetical protein [Portunus trituberculatus]
MSADGALAGVEASRERMEDGCGTGRGRVKDELGRDPGRLRMNMGLGQSEAGDARRLLHRRMPCLIAQR